MFFLASATIADRHDELREEVRALDGYLQANDGHTFRLGHAARILRLDADLVQRLLENFEGEGVVKREVAYICPKCDGFLERVPGEGDLWCDVCDESVTYRGRGQLGEKAWRTLVEAVRTGFAPSADNEPGHGSPAATAVVQFIAGDRGGGLTPQVKVTREEKEIASAINQGARRHRIHFAAPIYLASIADVIACHRFHPAIVHFAGHGLERRLVLVQDRDVLAELRPLQPEQVCTLFANYPQRVRLVLFNTCLSLALARHLVEQGAVDIATGIEGMIADDYAIAFAAGFYRQVSDGLSVQRAFNLASLHLGDTDASARPHLLCAEGIDADNVIFAGD
jgi:hypothetical protein